MDTDEEKKERYDRSDDLDLLTREKLSELASRHEAMAKQARDAGDSFLEALHSGRSAVLRALAAAWS